MRLFKNINNPKTSHNSSQCSDYNMNKKLGNSESTLKNKVSQPPTNFEQFPYNQSSKLNASIEEDLASNQQFSADNQSQKQQHQFNRYLNQIQEQLKLKTKGMDQAIKIVEQCQAQKRQLTCQLRQTQQKLAIAQNQILELQQKLYNPPIENIETRYNSSAKKSITKIIVSNPKILEENQSVGLLRNISVGMLVQYAESYDQIFRNWEQWVDWEGKEQEELGLEGKFGSYQLQCQELFRENREQQHILGAVQCQKYCVTIQDYNQLFKKYKEYEQKMQQIVSQCLNYIEQLSSNYISPHPEQYFNLNPIINNYAVYPSPRAQQTHLKTLTKEIHSKYGDLITSIKQDNKELKNILEELIRWVKKNLGENKMKEFTDYKMTTIKKEGPYRYQDNYGYIGGYYSQLPF